MTRNRDSALQRSFYPRTEAAWKVEALTFPKVDFGSLVREGTRHLRNVMIPLWEILRV